MASNELRPYQIEAIASLRSALIQGYKRPVLHLPTGAGKSRIAAEIILEARKRDKRVVFCVPQLVLIDQTLKMFHAEGIRNMAVIQAQHPDEDWSAPVQICSAQTLMRRNYPEADLVIIDECHRHFRFYEKWMWDEKFIKVPFIGLSATPWTKGLGRWWDHLVIANTTAQLIEEGYLSSFRVFAPYHPDLKGVRTVAGDWHEGDLAERMDKDVLVADIVDTWIRRGENRPTLAFCINRAHAKNIQQRFIASGINAGYMDAFTPERERSDIKCKFHDGIFPVVCNVGVLTMGVDWDVRCIILARPTKSEILFTQIIGRGLRPAEGKDHCLILDHSNSHERLGFVTDIHHDRLDDGMTERATTPKKEGLPKECPKCSYLRAPTIAVCPNCGYKAEAPKSRIENKDGELREIKSGKPILTAYQGKPGFISFRGKQITLAEFYGQLLSVAIQKKYNLGWCGHKFREATGIWPNRYKNAIPLPVIPEVASWLLSKQIAFAKRRRVA